MQTRTQKDSKQAYEHISQLQLSETDSKLYGSICHTFPSMVLRSGLAQSVAFLWIKAESNKPAYQTFLVTTQRIISVYQNHKANSGNFPSKTRAIA